MIVNLGAPEMNMSATRLLQRLQNQSSVVGVIGLGYVGLPLVVTSGQRGFRSVGFDTDANKVAKITAGESYIEAVTDDHLRGLVSEAKLAATTDFTRLAECDVIIVCVPTPLTKHREPDLSYVEKTAETISKHMTAETLVVLESTTYPGTTEEVLLPILSQSGLEHGQDFYVGFSPEREDPGNASYRTATIPKIVAGLGDEAGKLIEAFYERVVDQVVPVSSPRVAEAVKISEKIFRAVNIALVNELKVIYDAMDVDVWEVIDAAATKPFGFMPFYPGPGLGGHCIPIDPFYLTWKAREYDVATRFIELAGEINTDMPRYVIARLRLLLDRFSGKGLNGSRVLIVGLAYKKNVSDMRESPSMRLMQMLEEVGCQADYLDPHVLEIPKMREYMEFQGRKAVVPEQVQEGKYDALLVATDHDAIDYEALVNLKLPILDTRNTIARLGLPMDWVMRG